MKEHIYHVGKLAVSKFVTGFLNKAEVRAFTLKETVAGSKRPICGMKLGPNHVVVFLPGPKTKYQAWFLLKYELLESCSASARYTSAYEHLKYVVPVIAEMKGQPSLLTFLKARNKWKRKWSRDCVHSP